MRAEPGPELPLQRFAKGLLIVGPGRDQSSRVRVRHDRGLIAGAERLDDFKSQIAIHVDALELGVFAAGVQQ